MDKEKQRIAIATACGWHSIWICRNGDNQWPCGFPSHVEKPSHGTHNWWTVPDYLNDLNAMHEAEKVLTSSQEMGWSGYWETLAEVTECGGVSGREGGDPSWFYSAMAHATAAQRAEAFLKTLNLWTE